MRRTNGGEVGPAAGGPNVRTGRALAFEGLLKNIKAMRRLEPRRIRW